MQISKQKKELGVETHKYNISFYVTDKKLRNKNVHQM